MLGTESAFHNQLESNVSIIEKQAKFQKPIYSEIIKIVNTVERQNYVIDAGSETEADMRHILGFLN